jgi:activator of the mannose operon (transcriptional antiterminator)
MLTKRQKEFLELLAEQSDFQTVEYFASKLGVSKRTAHSELKIIEEYIQKSGEYLEKKRGVGIALRKLKESSLLEEAREESDVCSTINRRIQLMNMLLFEEKKVSFNYLSEFFMVSKTSIVRDFELIMKILKAGSSIKLANDAKGTFLSGTEEDFQKAFLQFNRYLFSNSDYYLGSDFTEKIKLLEPYYGETLISVCTNILYTYVRENINVISDYYIQNVLNIFVILVYRIQQQQHLDKKNLRQVNEQDLFFEKSAVQMIHKAALRLNLAYTNEDVQYFSQQLISNRFEPLPEQETDTDITNQLLFKVSEALTIDFSKDRELETQLKNHIPPMLYRLRSNNKAENPFTSQIKNEFSLTFNVIWVVLSEYEQSLAIHFNEDEIAFLTMYFQAAIERARMNRKILVVCQMGIATSELLINRIKSVLPSLDTLEVASFAELEQKETADYDLIISTIKVTIPHKKVVYVSPFLTDKDIEKIHNSGYRPKKISQVAQVTRGHHLQKFVRREFIYLNAAYSSKDELISQVGQDLIAKGYVQPKFIESVKEREEFGGTDLPSGTAVPHGNSIYVNQTVIVVVKNRKKIKWSKYSVDLAFLICIAKQDTFQTRNILADIYNLIDNNQGLKELRNANSKERLYKKLGSE